MKVKVPITQSWLTLRPHDSSPPGSSVHGILQATILHWAVVVSKNIGNILEEWNDQEYHEY